MITLDLYHVKMEENQACVCIIDNYILFEIFFFFNSGLLSSSHLSISYSSTSALALTSLLFYIVNYGVTVPVG